MSHEAYLKSLCDQLEGTDATLFLKKLSETDNTPIQLANAMFVIHPNYSVLAARIKLHEIYSRSKSTLLESVCAFSEQLDPQFVLDVVHFAKCGGEENIIQHENDQLFSYYALEMLEDIFLLKSSSSSSENDPSLLLQIIERPQFLFARVAIHLHGRDMDKIQETYKLLSEHKYVHSTPTLMNAGRLHNQLSSCFLMPTPTTDNLIKCFDKCHTILKNQGGIGINFHNIPSRQFTAAAKTLNGITQLAANHNSRPTSVTVYIEPWHDQVQTMLNFKKNTGGPEESKVRDLFFALWIPDLFMQRVKRNQMWSLFCPEKIKNVAPALHSVWGEEFDQVYRDLEERQLYERRINARDLFREIAITQLETGQPFILFKDTCNRESPYPDTIEGSNLCTEIMEHASDRQGTAVCNLASISLPTCVVVRNCCDSSSSPSPVYLDASSSSVYFDVNMLKYIVRIVVQNLNKTIDVTKYPTKCSRRNNLKYRPIAIGVTGLADVFQMLRYDYDSLEAKALNMLIFKTIYETAKSEASEYRNDLVTAVMPTATTSVLMDNCENVEPFTNNLYIRRMHSGELTTVNKHLVKDLVNLGMWNLKTYQHIEQERGSVQTLKGFPYSSLYRTVWEIAPESLIEMASDRSKYIDHSQSLNMYLADPTPEKIMSLVEYAFDMGLKTGMYYLRSKPAVNPIPFSNNIITCDDYYNTLCCN